MKQGLGRDQRIKKKSEFKQLFDQGKSARGKFFSVWILETSSGKIPSSRCAVSVSKKVDTRATVRNLWKRRIREAFRRNQDSFKPGIAVLFKARAGMEAPAYGEIEREMKYLLGKTGFLK